MYIECVTRKVLSQYIKEIWRSMSPNNKHRGNMPGMRIVTSLQKRRNHFERGGSNQHRRRRLCEFAWLLACPPDRTRQRTLASAAKDLPPRSKRPSDIVVASCFALQSLPQGPRNRRCSRFDRSFVRSRAASVSGCQRRASTRPCLGRGVRPPRQACGSRRQLAPLKSNSPL